MNKYAGVAAVAVLLAVPFQVNAATRTTLQTKLQLGAKAGLRTADATSTATSTTSVNNAAKMARAIAQGDKEIDRRVAALNSFSTRIDAMTKISDAEKTVLKNEVQVQVTALTSLRAKIDADTDASVLKTDIKAITDSYRTFALFIPQGQILAAADRAGGLVDTMIAVGIKFQAAITAAQTAGKDITFLQTTYADYTAKVADATSAYQEAGNIVAALVPDQGDTTVAASNKATLLKARADIKKAVQDLVAARKDANTMQKTLKSFQPKTNVNVNAGATTTATSTH